MEAAAIWHVMLVMMTLVNGIPHVMNVQVTKSSYDAETCRQKVTEGNDYIPKMNKEASDQLKVPVFFEANCWAAPNALGEDKAKPEGTSI